MCPLVHAFLMNDRVDEAVHASISNVSVEDIPHNAGTDSIINLMNMAGEINYWKPYLINHSSCRLIKQLMIKC